MNKTKKYKYLRKNRHSNKKNKTRMMQRGGQPSGSDNPEIIVAKIEQQANQESINNQKPNYEIPGILGKAKAWFIKKFTLGTAENMKDIEEQKRLEQLLEVSSVTDANIRSQIEYFNAKNNGILARLKSLRHRLTGYPNRIVMRGGGDDDDDDDDDDGDNNDEVMALKTQIERGEAEMFENNERIGILEASLGADPTTAIGAFNNEMMGPGMMGMPGMPGMSSQHTHGTAAKAAEHDLSIGAKSATEKAHELTGATTAEAKAAAAASTKAAEAEAKAAAKAAEAQAKAEAKAAEEKRKAEAKSAEEKRKAEAKALIDEQIQKEKAAGLTRRKSLLGRTGDSFKNLFNRTQKQKQKPDTASSSESEPLLGNSTASDGNANSNKSWSESANARLKTAKNAIISTKDALLKRITRKNRGTQNPKYSEIEMQEMPLRPPPTPVAAAAAVSPPTPANEAAVSPSPPPPSSRVPPPIAPRPNSFSPSDSSSDSVLTQKVQSQVSDNVGNWDDTYDEQLQKEKLASLARLKINPTKDITVPSPSLSSLKPLAPPPPPSNTRQQRNLMRTDDFPDMITFKGGGNITRKNRQYIHEIKDNRTHLFNKEMEIINSIRNFKHGHHHGHDERGKNKPENIQKKFIKVIKRS